MVTKTEAQTTQNYLERVRRLASKITDAAADSEKRRRLTDDLQADLHKAGLFRMLLPKVYGGAEVDPITFFHTIEEVAKYDGSTAWCLCQGNGCTMVAAYLEPSAAEEMWKSDPNAVLAWGPGKGELRETEHGYILNGNWAFASGGRHANWLGAHIPLIAKDGTPVLKEDGTPQIRTALFPAENAPMKDIWDVIGLRATGSDGYGVSGLVVPKEFVVARDHPDHRKIDTTLYQFPATNLYAIGFSGTAMGLARAMLDAFKNLTAEKKPRLGRSRLAESPVIQTDVAQAEARLQAARVFLRTEVEDIWADVSSTNKLTIPQRMRIRLATTHGIHEAKNVANTVYDLAGATAVFSGSAFERRFRDIHTVTQQLQGRKDHFQTVGAFMLGNEPYMAAV